MVFPRELKASGLYKEVLCPAYPSPLHFPSPMCWNPVVVAAARAAGMKVRLVGRGDWLDRGGRDCLGHPAAPSALIVFIHLANIY